LRSPEQTIYLQRLRFRADLAPSDTIRFAVEAADARSHAFADAADLRIAYAEFGREKTATLRLGRQEISIGDESLVGADGEWCNLGRTFDAVSVSVRGFRAFSGQVVDPSPIRPNRSSPAAQLSGIHYEGPRLQPFALWKRTAGGLPRSIYTAGTYASGQLPLRAEYNLTFAVQRGTSLGQPLQGWASGVSVSRQLGGESGPVVSAWTRRASSRFDDLYPAGYNAAGTLDLFAWRNLADSGSAVEWRIGERVDALVECHRYSLLNHESGLYLDDGPPAGITPATSYLGVQINAAIGLQLTKNTRVQAGHAYLHGSTWIRGNGLPLSTSYLMLARRI
jgi:hypothetical protein